MKIFICLLIIINLIGCKNQKDNIVEKEYVHLKQDEIINQSYKVQLSYNEEKIPINFNSIELKSNFNIKYNCNYNEYPHILIDSELMKIIDKDKLNVGQIEFLINNVEIDNKDYELIFYGNKLSKIVNSSSGNIFSDCVNENLEILNLYGGNIKIQSNNIEKINVVNNSFGNIYINSDKIFIADVINSNSGQINIKNVKNLNKTNIGSGKIIDE